MNLNIGKNWPLFICAIGGLLVVIGSFLPWIKMQTTFETVTKSGIDYKSNGITTLILGIFILLGIAVSVAKPKFIPITPTYLVIVCSLWVVIVGAMNYMDVNNELDDISNVIADASGSVGAGLYLVIIGGILGLAGIFPLLKKPEKTTSRRKR